MGVKVNGLFCDILETAARIQTQVPILLVLHTTNLVAVDGLTNLMRVGRSRPKAVYPQINKILRSSK